MMRVIAIYLDAFLCCGIGMICCCPKRIDRDFERHARMELGVHLQDFDDRASMQCDGFGYGGATSAGSPRQSLNMFLQRVRTAADGGVPAPAPIIARSVRAAGVSPKPHSAQADGEPEPLDGLSEKLRTVSEDDFDVFNQGGSARARERGLKEGEEEKGVASGVCSRSSRTHNAFVCKLRWGIDCFCADLDGQNATKDWKEQVRESKAFAKIKSPSQRISFAAPHSLPLDDANNVTNVRVLH